MITIEDMAMIIADSLSAFGMPIYIKGHIPEGGVSSDGRITITPKDDSDGRIFDKCFVEVNFLLPDVSGEANMRLDNIERDAYEIFRKGMADEFDGQYYNISYSRRSRENDSQLKSHYVHFQLLFEILNTL